MPAFDAVQVVLSQFPWLQMLGPQIYQMLVDGVTLDEPADVIVQKVRDSAPYKQRFKGMAQRQASGLPAISEAEYLTVEQGYYDQLREFNVLGTLGFTNPDAFRAWAADRIGKNVSVSEINRRLDRGVALARDASDFVQEAFRSFYGGPVSEDALTVYFLDQQMGMDIIEDQIAAAQVGGEAFRFGLNISRTRAEILRKEGVTADLAKEGFSDIARELPVLSRLAQIHNTAPLTQQELEEFFFHNDPAVGERRARTFSSALAKFQGAGATNVNREGGLGELVDRDQSV